MQKDESCPEPTCSKWPLHFHALFIRRGVLLLWKQRNGSKATYNKLIGIFESTGYQNYADNVKRMTHVDEEGDVSGGPVDLSPPLPQPPTYCSVRRNSPPSSPEDVHCEREEYELLDLSDHDETKGIVVSRKSATAATAWISGW